MPEGRIERTGERRHPCQEVTERDRAGKGWAQAAGGGLAAASSEGDRRQEPARDKGTVAVGAATGLAVAGQAREAARVEAWAAALDRRVADTETGYTTTKSCRDPS